MRGWFHGVVVVLTVASIANGKGREPQVTTRRLTAPETFESLTLPKGTAIRLESAWDAAAGQFTPEKLARFTLRLPLDLCGTQVPANTEIEVRRGAPAFSWAEMAASNALHIVWHTKVAATIGARRVPAGSLVGFECGAGQLSLLTEPTPFSLDQLNVRAAAWYPTDIAHGLLWVQLASPAELDGVHVPADFLVTFTTSGHVVRLMGPANAGVMFADQVCSGGGPQGIVIDEKHRPACDEVKTYGATCDANYPIRVNDAHDLAQCKLAAPFHAGGRDFAIGASVRFAGDGSPR